MTEPTIICPNCKTEIKLTESLAAPLIEATRRQYEARLATKDADVAKREAALREREEAVSKPKESIHDQVTKKGTTGRMRYRWSEQIIGEREGKLEKSVSRPKRLTLRWTPT